MASNDSIEIEIIDALVANDEIELKTACTSHVKASLDEIMGIPK